MIEIKDDIDRLALETGDVTPDIPEYDYTGEELVDNAWQEFLREQTEDL